MRFKCAFNLSHWSKSISAIGFRDHPKVIWSYIKGGKGGKDHIRFNSFMSRLREWEQESKGDFWTVSCGVSAAEFQQRSNNSEVSAGQFFSKAEISCKSLLADFCWIFSCCKKAFFRNKEELSNWFSPRVVEGFSRVMLTKNISVLMCFNGWLLLLIFISAISIIL